MALCLSVYVLWPAQALANAVLRVVHAVPGAGTATLDLKSGGKTTALGPIAFGQASTAVDVPSGPFSWSLASGGKTVMTGTGEIGDGPYTGVLMYKGTGIKEMGVMFHLYRDRTGVAGTSLVRVIHSASELGSPSLQLDGKTVVKQLNFMQATPYLSVKPGVHSLDAMAPGHTGAILAVNGVTFDSGVAYTEIVVGTRGQRVRVLTVTNRGAPLTHTSAPVNAKRVTAAPDTPWVTVQPGDSLWKIAAHRVGANASDEAVYQELVRIWDANATRIGTGDPNLIFPGTRLQMPSAG